MKARLLRVYVALERRFGPRAEGLPRPRRLPRIGAVDLAATLEAAGRSRVKTRYLHALSRWLLRRFRGRLDGLRRAPLPVVRREMLALPGLGPETVDAILLHAAGRPVFVADASVRRVLSRHGVLPRGVGYEAARRVLEAHLPSDPALFNEFHALLVAVAKVHCRAVACCEGCPLRDDLMRSPGGRPRSARPRRARRARGPARPSP